MFWKIFLFEIQNRFRRPAVYLYFLAAFIFTVGTFATGSLPIGEKENINAPYLIAMWCAGITMLMMLISSSVMGQALYRDIEYQTKDYYLTYPITRQDISGVAFPDLFFVCWSLPVQSSSGRL